MKLRDINKKEFENFCNNNSLGNQNSFFQTKYYAELKRREGYHTYFVGLVKDGNVHAATMLLSKEVGFFKKRVFYAPRGFIINYSNLELLTKFTEELKQYIKNKNGIYVKMDPFIIDMELNDKGDVVPGGLNNHRIIENLLENHYIRRDEDHYIPKEPKISYQIELKGKNEEEILNQFDEEIRSIIKRNEAIGITTRKLTKEDVPKFIDIIENSSNTLNHLNIGKESWTTITNILASHHLLDMTIAELDIDKYLDATEKSRRNTKDDAVKEQLNKQISVIKNLQYKYGHKILLGGVLGISNQDNYLTLVSSTIDRFHNFNPLYTLYWNTMRDAKKNGMKYYTFYGIGNKVSNDTLKDYIGYHGDILEYIGEFDLVVNISAYKKIRKQEAEEFKYQ